MGIVHYPPLPFLEFGRFDIRAVDHCRGLQPRDQRTDFLALCEELLVSLKAYEPIQFEIGGHFLLRASSQSAFGSSYLTAAAQP